MFSLSLPGKQTKNIDDFTTTQFLSNQMILQLESKLPSWSSPLMCPKPPLLTGNISTQKTKSNIWRLYVHIWQGLGFGLLKIEILIQIILSIPINQNMESNVEMVQGPRYITIWEQLCSESYHLEEHVTSLMVDWKSWSLWDIQYCIQRNNRSNSVYGSGGFEFIFIFFQ